MKFSFEGTPEEFADAVNVLVGPHADDLSDEGVFIPWDELAELEMQTAESEKPRIGAVQRFVMMRKWAKSGQTLRQWRQLDDDDLATAVSKTAAAKGMSVSAFGDGKLLEQFLAFISEHWDEIFALLLKLIGL